MAKNKTDTFSQKDVLAAINNAFVMSSRPSTIGELTDARKARLSVYTQALIAPVKEHCAEELILLEEVVYFLLGTALFFQAQLMGTNKIPAFSEGKRLVNGEE